MNRLSLQKCLICLGMLLIAVGSFFCSEKEYGVNTIMDELSYIYPNPFTPTVSESSNGYLMFHLVYKNDNYTNRVGVKVSIDTYEQRSVWSFSHEFSLSEPENVEGQLRNTIEIRWPGRNDEGKVVSPGIYRAHVIVESLEQLKPDEQVSTYAGGISSMDFTIVVQ